MCVCACAVALDDARLQLRQYSIRFKKSGTRIPRVALTEMGPTMGLSVRRYRLPPSDMVAEAMKVARTGKKKVRAVDERGRGGQGWASGLDARGPGACCEILEHDAHSNFCAMRIAAKHF